MALDLETQRAVIQKLKDEGHNIDEVRKRFESLSPEGQDTFMQTQAQRLQIISAPSDGGEAPISFDDQRADQIDEALQNRGAVATTIRKTAKGMFDIPTRLAAGVEAIGEEVQQALGKGTDKTLVQRYNEIIKREDFITDRLEERNPKAAIVGDVAGFFGASSVLGAAKLGKYVMNSIGKGSKAVSFLGRLAATATEVGAVESAQALTQTDSKKGAGDVAAATGVAVGGQAAIEGAIAVGTGALGVTGKALQWASKPAIKALRKSASPELLAILDDLPKAVKLKSKEAQQAVFQKFTGVIDGLKQKLDDVSGDALSVEAQQLKISAQQQLDDVMQNSLSALEAGKVDDVADQVIKMGGKFKLARKSLNKSYGEKIQTLYKDAGDTKVSFFDELRPLFDDMEEAGIVTLGENGSVQSVSSSIMKKYPKASDFIRTIDPAKNELTFEQANKLKSILGDIADFGPSADDEGRLVASVWSDMRNKLSNPEAYGEAIATKFNDLSTSYASMRRVTDTLARSSSKIDTALGTGSETLLTKLESAFKAEKSKGVAFTKTDLGGKIDHFLNQTEFNVLDVGDKAIIKDGLNSVRQNMTIRSYQNPTKLKSIFKNVATKGPDYVRDNFDELSKYFDVAEASRAYARAAEQMPVPGAVQKALANPTKKEALLKARQSLQKAGASDLLNDFNALHKKLVTQKRLAALPSESSDAIRAIEKLGALPEKDLTGLQYMYDAIPEFQTLLKDAKFAANMEKQPGVVATMLGLNEKNATINAVATLAGISGLASNGFDSTDLMIAAPLILLKAAKNPVAFAIGLEQLAGMGTKQANALAQKMFTFNKGLSVFGKILNERQNKKD